MENILPNVYEIGTKEELNFNLADICNATQPVEIEIGCGNGRFLIAKALKNPEISYIGVERMIDRVRKVSKKTVNANLTNLTVLRVEAGRFVQQLLKEHTVSAFYLFFPDPWPKHRHHIRRFFQRERCDDLARTLIPGGAIHVSTDFEDYYKEIYKYLSADERFEEIPHLVRLEDEQTDFERLFLSKNQDIFSCSFRLKK